MFDKMFPADYLEVTSPKLGTRTEPMRVKKLRNLNETILTALKVPKEARDVLTARAAKTVGEAYADDVAQLEFIKDTGANSLAIFTGGSATSSPSQFMADLGVKVSSSATKGIRVTKNLLKRAGLLPFLEEGDAEYLKTLPQSGTLVGNEPIESDPEVTRAQNQNVIARLDKETGELTIAAAEQAEDVAAAEAKLAQTKKEQKAEAAAQTNEQTRSSLLGKAMKFGKPIVRLLPPVAFGLGFGAGYSRTEGLSFPVRAVAGLAEGTAEVVLPPGAAPSDAPFRAEQRSSAPIGLRDNVPGMTGLGPRQDVLTQTDPLSGEIRPEFMTYPGYTPSFSSQGEPINPSFIQSPPPAQPSFLEAGAAKDRVNLATRAAEQGKETTMTGSFINQPM